MAFYISLQKKRIQWKCYHGRRMWLGLSCCSGIFSCLSPLALSNQAEGDIWDWFFSPYLTAWVFLYSNGFLANAVTKFAFLRGFITRINQIKWSVQNCSPSELSVGVWSVFVFNIFKGCLGRFHSAWKWEIMSSSGGSSNSKNETVMPLFFFFH